MQQMRRGSRSGTISAAMRRGCGPVLGTTYEVRIGEETTQAVAPAILMMCRQCRYEYVRMCSVVRSPRAIETAGAQDEEGEKF